MTAAADAAAIRCWKPGRCSRHCLKKKLAEVESEIEKLRSNLHIADGMVYEGNKQFRNFYIHYSTNKNIERKQIQSAQSKINIGIERKRKCDDDLARCWGKNKKLQNKIVLHPYHMSIIDPTHLLKVGVFLCFSEYELIQSASFEQYVCFRKIRYFSRYFLIEKG